MEPFGFTAGTIGVAHSETSTFLNTPLYSWRSSSASTLGLSAKGRGRALQNFGVASGLRYNLALTFLQWPS